jgi:hypothetical protein
VFVCKQAGSVPILGFHERLLASRYDIQLKQSPTTLNSRSLILYTRSGLPRSGILFSGVKKMDEPGDGKHGEGG